ncbi:unnamed protein product, partial [marine sediment metagenome]
KTAAKQVVPAMAAINRKEPGLSGILGTKPLIIAEILGLTIKNTAIKERAISITKKVSIFSKV